jgi:hypothetical protein
MTPDGVLRAIQGTGASDRENRLPVDPGQTGFFEGREFRTFTRLDIPTESELVLEATIPINFILRSLTVELILGQVEVITTVGGTPGGTFSETLPVFPRNNMTEIPTPAPTTQMTITAGGTIAGATELDVVMVKASDDIKKSSSVGALEGDERGIVGGTYHISIVNTDGSDAIGTLHAFWEERP